MQATAEAEALTLFDLSSVEVQVKLPGESKILFIPLKPVHHKALKLQNLIEVMDRQAMKNGAQFNSRNYLEALTAFENCAEQIRSELNEEILDARELDPSRDAPTTREVGDGTSFGLGSRVSTNNPLTG